MKQRIKISAFPGILLIVSLFFMSCGDTKTTSLTETGGTGGLGVTLKWKDILGKMAAKSAVKSTVPLDVATVRVSISGPDMMTITKDFSASSGGGIINAVPAGTDRKVSALGLDITGYVLYSGNVSGITITGGTTTTVEIILLPTGVTATECLNAVNQGNVIEARDICVAAANSYESIVSNDADTARFFAALSRVAALWYNQASDGNPNNGLLTAGDILDAFGCSVFGRDPEKPDYTCPGILPSNSPTGGELKTFINNVMRPEIAGAIDNLNYVSQSFNINWIEPIDGTTVESDFGDVLAAKALFKSLLASIIIENSYNLDADFDLRHPYTIGQFLADNPNFLKLVNASELSSAQNYLSGASDDALSAINWIQAETDNQNNDFINLLDQTSSEINDAKTHINEFKTSLTGSVNLYYEYNLNNGLVTYYPFNGNANDESGNGHDGTVSGALLTSDRFGQPNSAYSFDGVNDSIVLNNTSTLNFTSGGFTLVAWAKFDQTNTDRAIVGKHNCGISSGYFLGAGNYGGPNNVFSFFVNSDPRLHTTETYNDGQWHLVVGVYDGTTQYLYVDGVLKVSQAKTNVNTNTANITIGATNCAYFAGSIDDVRIYDRALSVSEISALNDKKTQMYGTLNLTNFFIGMDLRNFLPTYSGDIPGFFPAPTFNGIWTNYTPGANGDPNRDLDGNGSPDVID